jgi:cadmium resistance protein CadD (predicted permease)
MLMEGNFLELLGLGIATFVATNIDDLFILMAFFANRRFPISQVVLGQYVGMGSLIAVSMLASLIALVVPNNLIGLIGIFPIAIGIKELLELRKNGDDEQKAAKQPSQRSKGVLAYLLFITVAGVTFSGSEEIGIYTSVFAINNKIFEIIVIISVIMGLTGVWCGVAAYLVNHSFLADHFRQIANRILPFILIGLGAYILIEAFLLA